MKFILSYPDTDGPDAHMFDVGPLAEVAAAAEKAGWDGFALTDHPAPGANWMNAGGHQTLDPFVALGYVAAATARIRLITYLAIVPYRNPLLLAKSAATVDLLSGGRLTLGAGVGYLKSEYFALGVDFDERNELFDEALTVLPLHWSGEPFTFQGKHFSAREVLARPAPVQQPIPIWIGGNSTLSLRRAATHGNGWMPMLGGAQMARTSRSPHLGSLEAVAERIAVLREQAGDRFGDLDIVLSYSDPGLAVPIVDPDRHREALAAYEAIGATWIAIKGPGGPHPATVDFAAEFGEVFLR